MKARRVGRPVEIAGTYLIILARRKELRRVSVPPFTNGHGFRSAPWAGETRWVVSRWRRRPLLLCILVPGHPLKTRVALAKGTVLRFPPAFPHFGPKILHAAYGLDRVPPAIQTDRSSSFRMPLSHVYPKPDKRTEKACISERAEKTAINVTADLPFSEWTRVFRIRACAERHLDRITNRVHIEMVTEAFRFRRTTERRKKR